jgi:hypothetical protein
VVFEERPAVLNGQLGTGQATGVEILALNELGDGVESRSCWHRWLRY